MKTPEPTDVLSYVYLWADEAAQGREEGSKERPVVVVLAVEQVGKRLEVIVAPFTTKAPHRGDAHFELAPATIQRLGLSADRCWVVTTELNRFRWPGPDIRPIRGTGDRSPYYGKLPASQFIKLREMITKPKSGKPSRIVKRTE
jgi:hypothetical protein